jgi:hypothetical protein
MLRLKSGVKMRGVGIVLAVFALLGIAGQAAQAGVIFDVRAFETAGTAFTFNDSKSVTYNGAALTTADRVNMEVWATVTGGAGVSGYEGFQSALLNFQTQNLAGLTTSTLQARLVFAAIAPFVPSPAQPGTSNADFTGDGIRDVGRGVYTAAGFSTEVTAAAYASHPILNDPNFGPSTNQASYRSFAELGEEGENWYQYNSVTPPTFVSLPDGGISFKIGTLSLIGLASGVLLPGDTAINAFPVAKMAATAEPLVWMEDGQVRTLAVGASGGAGAPVVISAVPEPSTIVMTLIALAFGVVWYRKK